MVVNLVLALYLWLPRAGIAAALIPIPEALVLVLLVYLAPGSRWARLVLGAVTGVLIGFSLVEAVFQFVYARSFVPRVDIQMISGLLYLLFGEIGDLAMTLRPVVFALITVVFVTVGILLVRGIDAVLHRARPTGTTMAVVLGAAVVLLVVTGPPRSLTALTTLSWLEDGRVNFVRHDTRPADGSAGQMGPAAEPVPDYTFPGLKDRDIYIFAVEAYGYATISRETMADLVGPSRDRFADALRAEGYEFRSSFLLSPVAGGFSWLAEATFLTGQWIDSQNAFLQLYDASLPTLTEMLHTGGYYTFTLKPGTVHASWPEGWDLFRFEEAMVAFDGDFNYSGPWFSYVPITDQFTLWAAHNRIAELTAPGGPVADTPLLAYYQLVSSHTPFNKIPPLIENWEDLGDGSVYHEREDEIRTFNNSWGGGTEMDEGYSTAISYVFDSLGKYVAEEMDLSRDPIIIVFGDHQAQRPIREQEAHLSVPIHVASRDPEILALFEAEGYRPGLDGGQPPPLALMSTFFPTFARIATSKTERIVRGEANTTGPVR
ncbi:MAG: hypothetical protein PF508_07405 [Spirochaeta sp.]|nr:hypothetical protein [Spirochaeta sp.]